MTELASLALREMLPPSISDDDQLLAVAAGLDAESQVIVGDVDRFLPYLAGLDNLPSRILDLLAWQFHIDYWDSAADLAAKRARVREAIADHRLHGTRAAVESALEEIFGEGNFTLIEWWEDDPIREPYTFRITLSEAFTEEDIAAIQERLAVVCNVRSHWITFIIWNELDDLAYTWNDLDALDLTWNKFDHFYLFVVV